MYYSNSTGRYSKLSLVRRTLRRTNPNPGVAAATKSVFSLKMKRD